MQTSVRRTELERSDVPGTDLETRLYLIVYPPGAAAPVHHHPVDGIGYILEGAALTIFANVDMHRPLKFLVAYTVKKGAAVIEMP